MPATQRVDEPVQARDDDTLQRAHRGEHAARWTARTRSWEASVVLRLTGPWATARHRWWNSSPKCPRNRLRSGGLFVSTPWATSDTASLTGRVLR